MSGILTNPYLSAYNILITGTFIVNFLICVNAKQTINTTNKNVEENGKSVTRKEPNRPMIEPKINTVDIQDIIERINLTDLWGKANPEKPCTTLLQVFNFPVEYKKQDSKIVPDSRDQSPKLSDNDIIDRLPYENSLNTPQDSGNNLQFFLPPPYRLQSLINPLASDERLPKQECSDLACIFNNNRHPSKYYGKLINKSFIRPVNIKVHTSSYYAPHNDDFLIDFMVRNWFKSYISQLNPVHGLHNSPLMNNLYLKYLNLIKLILRDNSPSPWDNYKFKIHKWLAYCKKSKCWKKYPQQVNPNQNGYPTYSSGNHYSKISQVPIYLPSHSYSNKINNIIKKHILFYRYIFKILLKSKSKKTSLINFLSNFSNILTQVLKYNKGLIRQINALKIIYPQSFSQYEDVYMISYLRFMILLLTNHYEYVNRELSKNKPSIPLNYSNKNVNFIPHFVSRPHLIPEPQNLSSDYSERERSKIATTVSIKGIENSVSPSVGYPSILMERLPDLNNGTLNFDIIQYNVTNTVHTNTPHNVYSKNKKNVSMVTTPITSHKYQMEPHSHELDDVHEIEIAIEIPIRGAKVISKGRENNSVTRKEIYTKATNSEYNNSITNETQIYSAIKNNIETTTTSTPQQVDIFKHAKNKDLMSTAFTNKPLNVDAEFLEYVCPTGYYYDFDEDTCISVVPPLPVQLKLVNTTALYSSNVTSPVNPQQ